MQPLKSAFRAEQQADGAPGLAPPGGRRAGRNSPAHTAGGNALRSGSPTPAPSRARRRRSGAMLAGLGRAVRSLPPSDGRLGLLVGGRAARGRRDGRPPLSEPQVQLWRHNRTWARQEGASYSMLVPSDEVTINYRHGLPMITLTLPTRRERCQFAVKPVVATVGAFLQDIQREDKGIVRAEVFATDGSKVSDATLMEVLLMNDFKLVINNTTYSVSAPIKDKLSSEHATEMEDIKSLVHRLFVALHLEDHQIKKERELLQKLDHLKEQLMPLEQMKARIMDSADAKTSRLLWVGLALMSTQGGALAWLTWWVYSWDIMEPVTYFITYGSAMAFYAYFVLTKQDYVYPDAKDRQLLHYFYRKSKAQHFNVEQYNKLKEELAEVFQCST
uniref:Calcium uniporter regulatory subunit MCUb n=1 Tax=Gallus gallus TaxID=9031 RepID=A0A8V0XHW3_CHICK